MKKLCLACITLLVPLLILGRENPRPESAPGAGLSEGEKPAASQPSRVQPLGVPGNVSDPSVLAAALTGGSTTPRLHCRKERQFPNPPGAPEKAVPALSATGGAAAVIFRRVAEPGENAFTVLIPEGWLTEGGIFRVNPTAQGGAAQSIAAKLDFAVKNDKAGNVMIRWLPDVLFFDMRNSPAGQMGLFPPGSNYNGMTVFPLMPAAQFIVQIALPYAHPGIRNIRVTDQQNLPQLAQQYLQNARTLAAMIDFSYSAARVSVTYSENGQTYEERMIAVVENWGQAGAGLWGNKGTFLIRAPLKQLSQWAPILSVIQSSVRISQQWLSAEIRGQAERGEIMVRTQQELQRIEQQIVAHRQRTKAEVQNDMFLTLTGQEEYVNPFTSEVEVGSNHWKYRWENEAGEVIYTDDKDYDPRTDIHLNRTDFKRSPVRQRFGQ